MKFWHFLLVLFFATHTLVEAKEERTLALIKPNAVAENHVGAILHQFEAKGLHIAALKMLQLSSAEVRRFYAVHRERSFFEELVSYMSEGPIVAIVLDGDDALLRTRTLIGATDPKKADPGTLRALFGTSLTRNSLHSSDSLNNASTEIGFFFAERELPPPKK